MTDDEGRQADEPTQIGWAGWWQVLKRAWAESKEDQVGLISAGVAFYIFLAFVPLLGAAVLLWGLIADPTDVAGTLATLAERLPASAAEIIGGQLSTIASDAGGKQGLGLLIALALAIFGATKGAGAIVTALNIVYDEEEERGWLRQKLVALAITGGAVGLVVVTAALARLRGAAGEVSPALQSLAGIAFVAAMAALAMGFVAAVYRYAPDRDQPRWNWVSVGSVATTVLWVVASIAFGIYVANFGSYNATYGALGAVVAFLTWLYLCAWILLFGGELNAEAEHQTERDTTDGPDRPMGERDAYVADTVA